MYDQYKSLSISFLQTFPLIEEFGISVLLNVLEFKSAENPFTSRDYYTKLNNLAYKLSNFNHDVIRAKVVETIRKFIVEVLAII
jgi:hypothetical protein